MEEARKFPTEPPARVSLGHESLLTLARKAEGAARDRDAEHLETATKHFREALVDHLEAERQTLVRLPADEWHRLLRGQQSVLALVEELTDAARRPDLAPCDGIAQRLLAQLTLQADDERVNVARLEEY